MGPVGGILIVVIKFLMSLPFSKTAYVGDFADLLIGASYRIGYFNGLPKYKSKKGGLVALLLGSLT